MNSHNQSLNEIKYCPTPAAQTALIIITSLMAMTIIVANYTASKLWNFFGISVDGGLILFPLSYALGDILVEIYGRRTANIVSWSSSTIGALTCVVMFIVRLLPDYANADNSVFNTIADNTGRIFIASIVGFLASQMLNNYIFERIRFLQTNDEQSKSGHQFRLRALLSSALAHIPDILFFEPIAFLGILSFREFLSQAVFAYITSIAVEIVFLVTLTSPLVEAMAHWLKFRHGERI